MSRMQLLQLAGPGGLASEVELHTKVFPQHKVPKSAVKGIAISWNNRKTQAGGTSNAKQILCVAVFCRAAFERDAGRPSTHLESPALLKSARSTETYVCTVMCFIYLEIRGLIA